MYKIEFFKFENRKRTEVLKIKCFVDFCWVLNFLTKISIVGFCKNINNSRPSLIVAAVSTFYLLLAYINTTNLFAYALVRLKKKELRDQNNGVDFSD